MITLSVTRNAVSFSITIQLSLSNARRVELHNQVQPYFDEDEESNSFRLSKVAKDWLGIFSY